jgi:hypothetical protein
VKIPAAESGGGDFYHFTDKKYFRIKFHTKKEGYIC